MSEQGLGRIAEAITPYGAFPAPDAGGGIVGSLTEAVMGTTGGLMAIAAALDRIADALEQKKAI